jgi:rubrerythrin
MHDNLAPIDYQLLDCIGDAPDSLIELCKEYFEIAIGYRQPTEEEKRKASHRILRAGLFGDDQDLQGQISVLKYPLSTDQKPLLRTLCQLEYNTFYFLSCETDIIDGPFLPMLRYELNMQEEIREDERYPLALVRQSTFLETYFKMKMNKWKDSEGNFLSWEICVKSAFRGENLITEEEKTELYELAQVRNQLVHDWRTLSMRNPDNMEELTQAWQKGYTSISALYGREIKRVYEEYSSNHVSKILPTRWEDRERATTDFSAKATVGISCDNCGEEFLPRHEGYKRCPECDAPHDWLDRFG